MAQQYLIPNLRETIRNMIFQWYKDGKCIYQHSGEELCLESELSSVDFVKQTGLTHGVYRTTDDACFQVYDNRVIRLDLSDYSRSKNIKLLKHGQRVSSWKFNSIFRGYISWGVTEVIDTPHIKFLTDMEHILDIILEADIWQTAVQILGINELRYEEDPDRVPEIKFTILEVEETIPTDFSVNLNLADRRYYHYDISKNYLQALRKKAEPIVPYKDAGKFNYPPHTVLSTYALSAGINHILSSKKVERIVFEYEIEKLEASFRSKLAEFIFNDQQDYAVIHFVDVSLPRPGYFPLKAVRLYKTPAYDYSEDLQRIDSFKHRGTWARYAYGYLVGAIGVEISPDDYLELYAPAQILAKLFLEYIIDIKKEQYPDGTAWQISELNVCVWPCITADDLFSHYEDIIGSTQNKILDDELRILWWD